MNMKTRCACGGRALKDNILCFACMDARVRATDTNYTTVKAVRALGPLAAKTVHGMDERELVRVRWGPPGTVKEHT